MAASSSALLTERTPRVVSAVKLHRSAERRERGLFLAEGVNAVEAAIAAGLVRELFYTAGGAERCPELVEQASLASEVTERAMDRLADTVTPVGLVAVCELVDVPLAQVLSSRLVAMPVDVREPGNAGTIIRIADALGVDAVVLAGDSVDPHNGKCVRATAGSVFHLPIVRERDPLAAIDHFRRTGLQIVVATGDGELSLEDADLTLPTAWVFGNEAHGVDAAVAAAADHRVRIPIKGRAESLNLATAAAICLYASSNKL